MTTGTDWGRIARFSMLGTVLVAVVVFFALPDARWVAAVVLGLGVLDLILFTQVLPALTRSRGEITPIKDGDWGVPPPSGPVDEYGDPISPPDDAPPPSA